MTHQSTATLIGSLGVSLLLLAFFLNLFKFLHSEGYTYLILNLVGGGLACYSSYLIGFIPFVVLEATWAVVTAIALIREISKNSGASKHSTA